MPLVQCTPDRNGFSRHQERSCSATRSAYRSSLGQVPGGGQQREVLQAGDLPDLLDVADLLLRAVVDPERVAVRVGPAAGHRVAEPVGLLQVGPDHARAPPTHRAAAGPRRQRPPFLASSGHPAAVPGGSTAANRRSPGWAGRRPRASCRRVTCRGDQASRSTWSRARQATSAGDIRAARRAYQPSRDVDGRAHTCSGLPLSRLSRTAMVALVVAASDSSGIGMAAPARQASTKLASSARWPLSWPPRARIVSWPRPDQTVALRKLSSRALRPPPVASSVSFGKRDVAAGEVADHAAGAVGEPHRDLDVVAVRAAADRVDLLGQAVRPPAQRVQEVTALAGEPGPLALVAVPAVRGRAGPR